MSRGTSRTTSTTRRGVAIPVVSPYEITSIPSSIIQPDTSVTRGRHISLIGATERG